MFVLDRSWRARVQKYLRIVAAVVAFALLVTGLEAQQAAAAAPAADPKPAPAKVASRPDLVSAVVTARSQGSKVEVESMRSETSTTWANPDGTMTTEAHAAPIRFKTAKGAWQSVDLTLAKGIDGTVAPKGHGLGLQLGKQIAAVGGVRVGHGRHRPAGGVAGAVEASGAGPGRDEGDVRRGAAEGGPAAGRAPLGVRGRLRREAAPG